MVSFDKRPNPPLIVEGEDDQALDESLIDAWSRVRLKEISEYTEEPDKNFAQENSDSTHFDFRVRWSDEHAGYVMDIEVSGFDTDQYGKPAHVDAEKKTVRLSLNRDKALDMMNSAASFADNIVEARFEEEYGKMRPGWTRLVPEAINELIRDIGGDDLLTLSNVSEDQWKELIAQGKESKSSPGV